MRHDIRTRLARAFARPGAVDPVPASRDPSVRDGEGGSRDLAEEQGGLEILGGVPHTTPAGSVLIRRWNCPLEEVVSRLDLEQASLGAGVLAALLDNHTLGTLDPRRALYLDTETTGLAGGTGTYVFLLGLGWVEQGHFVVEQLFLRDVGEEPALLHRVAERATEFDVLVSFNGRRYDLPLLDTRLVLNRFDVSLRERPHLDLLQPARLLYGGRFENCRLQTLERELLGQMRHDDIPGAEIPARYFDYLSGGSVHHLLPVFEHNVRDVASLMGLTAHFMRLCQQPEIDIRALGNLGRLHERRGYRRQAQFLLEEARRRRNATYRDLRELGFLYKRHGEYTKALAIWQTLLARQRRADRSMGFDVIPWVEAAKHYEHRAGDRARALRVTTEAIEQLAQSGNGVSPRVREHLYHRVGRLRRLLDPA